MSDDKKQQPQKPKGIPTRIGDSADKIKNNIKAAEVQYRPTKPPKTKDGDKGNG
ncbi:hypothetical protein [Ekhidna sp.]